MSEESSGRSSGSDKPPVSESIKSVLDALGQLKFGAIQLTVHEGKLVQVDITERKRFSN